MNNNTMAILNFYQGTVNFNSEWNGNPKVSVVLYGKNHTASGYTSVANFNDLAEALNDLVITLEEELLSHD